MHKILDRDIYRRKKKDQETDLVKIPSLFSIIYEVFQNLEKVRDRRKIFCIVKTGFDIMIVIERGYKNR